MNIFFSILSGLVFGCGLILAEMVNPAKVLGFLDLAGLWDPSLGLIIGGGVAVGSVAFAVAKKRTKSLLGFPMRLPTAKQLDRRLIGGSLLFGVGWGLAGLCPGPALLLLGSGMSQGFIFVGAMLLGMGFFELLESRKSAMATMSESRKPA